MNLIELLGDLSGTLIATAATVAVILVGRLIFNKTAGDARTLPYKRQFFTFLFALLGLFIAIALLPLPAEIRSQILSVLGILLSAVIAFSSTTFVGNAMAGIMLRLMKGFRAGDFVEVDDRTGRVADIGLFHTEVQLVTRDILTVPNALLIQRMVRVTRRAGTFIDAAVSIGYATSHGSVEVALTEAAERSELAEPFVFVEELLDHAVRYRVYGLLEDSSELLTRRSQLKRTVLDSLHEHDIEIMSPGIVDRREYGPEHRFMPAAEAPEGEAGAQAGAGHTPEEQAAHEGEIEKIAFDRAEQAESIEQLYAEQEKLNHELAELADRSAEASQSKSADEKKSRKQVINSQLERIAEEIERRESEQEEKRLDEDASS